MNSFDRLIEQARNKALKNKVVSYSDTPTPRTVREKSPQEVSRPWTPPGWGILFCCHNRSYFDTCQSCKRDRKRAQLEFELFCKRRNISL